jgi:hypothetical protein
VSPGSGRARLHASNVALSDYHDFFNAISPAPTEVPSHVSFDVRWAGGGERQKIRDETFGFAGQYVGGDASIAFSASQDGSGVVYTSDAAGQTTVSAGVGHEHNGVFFP